MNVLFTPDQLPPPVAATPMMLLQIAMEQGADIDKLSKLMELQERWEKGEARKAFVHAMGIFKQNPPQIVKDKQVAFGQTKYKHAELDQVSSVLGASLARVGISHRWEIAQSDTRITVRCILTHELGHAESVELSAAADTSGQKNSIQAIASTVSYLERYTLLAATGTATGEADDDGRAGGISPDALHRLGLCTTQAELKVVYSEEYAKVKDNKQAALEIIAAKDLCKAALQQVAK